MRVRQISAIFLFIINILYGQIYSVYDFDPVVVTASRIPTSISKVARNVTTINRSQLKKANAASVDELLESLSGIDVKSRGAEGVQSDISIRGGTFEQTLILIDGVKISDSQTGHHNMNIPVNIADIEKIEILKGSGSRIFGHNAFGGVINIITRNSKQKRGNYQICGGEHGFINGAFSYYMPFNNSIHRLSVSKKKSDGYMHNSDFDIFTVFYKTGINTKRGLFDLSAGYMEKDFGANGFFAADFPEQREDIGALFVNGRSYFPQKWGYINTKLSWREHDDHFVLDFHNPGFYENFHTTQALTGEVQSLIKAENFNLSIGGEFGYEEIESNNLGGHYRQRSGLFVEANFEPGKNIILIPGAALFYHTKWGARFFPGVDFSYNFTEQLRLIGSAGKSYRVPTFTELYYFSPGNLGNRDLQPEEAWNYEIGICSNRDKINATLNFFVRHGSNLIDWTRENSSNPWQVMNIAQICTRGFETSFELKDTFFSQNKFITFCKFTYSFLDNDKNVGQYDSKYLLNNLHHCAVLNIHHKLYKGLGLNWNIRFEDRMYGESHILVDNQISWKRKFGEFYVKTSNLFDVEYYEFESLAMPGRWIKAGANLSFGKN